VKVSGQGESGDWCCGRLYDIFILLHTADDVNNGAPVSLNITQVRLKSAQMYSLFSVSSR